MRPAAMRPATAGRGGGRAAVAGPRPNPGAPEAWMPRRAALAVLGGGAAALTGERAGGSGARAAGLADLDKLEAKVDLQERAAAAFNDRRFDEAVGALSELVALEPESYVWLEVSARRGRAGTGPGLTLQNRGAGPSAARWQELPGRQAGLRRGAAAGGRRPGRRGQPGPAAVGAGAGSRGTLGVGGGGRGLPESPRRRGRGGGGRGPLHPQLFRKLLRLAGPVRPRTVAVRRREQRVPAGEGVPQPADGWHDPTPRRRHLRCQ